MAKADYHHHFYTHKDKNILAISDLDLGNMSVTNDMEAVVNECFARISTITPQNCYVVHKDSNGVYDGWDCKKRDFISLNEPTLLLAADIIIKTNL